MVQAHVLVTLQLTDCQPQYRAPTGAYGEIYFLRHSEHNTSLPNRPTGGSCTGKQTLFVLTITQNT